MRKLLVILILVLVGTQVIAKPRPKKISLQTDEIIQTLCAAYKELESYSGSMQTTLNVRMPDSKTSVKEVLEIAFVRPNKVYLAHEVTPLPQGLIVSDGTALWTYDQGLNQYSQEKAPDKVFPGAVPFFKGRPIRRFDLIMALMFAQDSYACFVEPFTSIRYIGADKLGDKDMLVLEGKVKFKNADGQVEGITRFWIGKADFLIHRIKSKTSGILPAEKSPTGKKLKFKEEFDMLCSHKVIDQDIDQKIFVFTPPQNSQQIKRTAILTGRSGETYAITVELPKPKKKTKPKPKLKFPQALGKEKKVVFVLDCSSSMDLRVGVLELVGAIKSLPKDCFFDVVRFGKIKSWKNQLTPATQASKYFASRWVADLKKGAPSTIIRGLEMALSYEPEVVYMITDGKGIFPEKMTDKFPIDKIEARVHWVYVDFPPARPAFVRILKDLARKTKGKFIPLIKVDE